MAVLSRGCPTPVLYALTPMFKWITSIISALGYVGVAVLTFLENLFPPIPSELVIPLAGFVAANGDMSLVWVIIAGTVGSLAGAALWYEIGRRVGEQRVRHWVARYGRWLTISAHDLDQAQAWFRRHGRIAVLIGRLVPGVRTFVSFPAGFARMPLWPFLWYSTIGTVAWTAVLAYSGVVLKANYDRVGDYIDIATYILLAGLAVVMVVRYVRCWRGTRDC